MYVLSLPFLCDYLVFSFHRVGRGTRQVHRRPNYSLHVYNWVDQLSQPNFFSWGTCSQNPLTGYFFPLARYSISYHGLICVGGLNMYVCGWGTYFTNTAVVYFRFIFFFLGYAGLHVSFEDHENKCLHNTASPGTALTILGISFAKIYIKSLL